MNGSVVYDDGEFRVVQSGNRDYAAVDSSNNKVLMMHLKSLEEALEIIEGFKTDEDFKWWFRERPMEREIEGIPPEHIIYYARPRSVHPFALSIHPLSEYRSTKGEIEKVPAHILFAHELGHQTGRHEIFARKSSEEIIKQEEEAWEIAAGKLKKAGEWTDENKEIAAQQLRSYYLDHGIGGIEEARKFMESL